MQRTGRASDSSPRHSKLNGNRIPTHRAVVTQNDSVTLKDDFQHLQLHKNKQQQQMCENVTTNECAVQRNDATLTSQRRRQEPSDNPENGCRRRTSQGGVSEVPQKVPNNASTTTATTTTPYSYGTYRASQYPQQEKLLNYHPLYHSPVINNKQPVQPIQPVDRYNNYYYGNNSRLADMSQGSCDNTPATPDSLDSLVGSDELCQSPPSISSEIPHPPPTEHGDYLLKLVSFFI